MIMVKEFKTHIAKVRDVHFNQMGHVCDLLNITREGYCWHQYKQYEAYVGLVCTQNPEFKDKIRHSDVFRGFWNNEWASRNEHEFLPFAYESKYDTKEIMAEYLYINSATRLFHEDSFYSRFENILKLI